MVVISPTITASDPHGYREQLERIEPFAERIHIDLADGEFAPTRLVPPALIYAPDEVAVDVHLMYKRPADQLETLIELLPTRIIIHAEAEGDLEAMLHQIQLHGIGAGIALLPQTQPDTVRHLVELADHVLIFAGKLGYHGGEADLRQLAKAERIRAIKDVEISWDGGINASNAQQIVQAGVDVLNVGSAIQRAEDPAGAYKELWATLGVDPK